MAATGRSYYPNVPGSLEEALAGATAAGTSPWAPILMMNARRERQQAISDVNETQANQYLSGLQAALQQAQIKAEGDIYGQMGRGGHLGGAMMRAANAGGYTHFDPNDIATETLLGQSGELANTGKAINEANKAGAEAGVRTDLSGLAAGLGFPTINSTPIATEGHEIAAGATLGAAKIGAASRVAAAKIRGPSGSSKTKGPSFDYTVQGQGPGGGTAVLKGVPLTALPNLMGKDAGQQVIDALTGDTSMGNATNATSAGDSIQRDPELPHILAAVAKSGAQLVGSNGNARYATNKKGQKVVVTDVVLPDGTHTTAETPTTRQ